jgi:hypothetical protein
MTTSQSDPSAQPDAQPAATPDTATPAGPVPTPDPWDE